MTQPTCIREQHCPVVENAITVINRIQEILGYEDYGVSTVVIVEQIRAVVDVKEKKK